MNHKSIYSYLLNLLILNQIKNIKKSIFHFYPKPGQNREVYIFSFKHREYVEEIKKKSHKKYSIKSTSTFS